MTFEYLDVLRLNKELTFNIFYDIINTSKGKEMIMMTKDRFMQWLREKSEAELSQMYALIDGELSRRERERAQRREHWINSKLVAYKNWGGSSRRVGDTTVVAVSSLGMAKMGTSTPVNGDEFDARTGIAVAFAKAIGETIPDFI